MPPANDNFADATDLGSAATGTQSVNASTATLETGEPMPSAASLSHSVWWKWTAPADGTTQFDTNGSAIDTVLAVYTGTALDNLVEVASDDDSGAGAASLLSFDAVNGTVYWIQAGRYSDEPAGNITLNWQIILPAANDNFADAENISSLSGSRDLITTLCTLEPGEPMPGAADIDHTAWWRWEAPSIAPTSEATFDTNGSAIDTVLAVYTGTALDNLVEVASNDDGGPNSTSVVSFTADAGTVYWIQAGSYSGNDGGDLTFNWTISPDYPPATNDDFVDAITITGASGSVASGKIDACTIEPGEPMPSATDINQTVWYKWTAPAGATTAQFDTNGTEEAGGPDTVLAVYTGTALDNLVEVASSDDDVGHNSLVSISVTAGRVYRIQVGCYSDGSTGSITLNWDSTGDDGPPPPPPPPPPPSRPSGLLLMSHDARLLNTEEIVEIQGHDIVIPTAFQLAGYPIHTLGLVRLPEPAGYDLTNPQDQNVSPPTFLMRSSAGRFVGVTRHTTVGGNTSRRLYLFKLSDRDRAVDLIDIAGNDTDSFLDNVDETTEQVAIASIPESDLHAVWVRSGSSQFATIVWRPFSVANDQIEFLANQVTWNPPAIPRTSPPDSPGFIQNPSRGNYSAMVWLDESTIVLFSMPTQWTYTYNGSFYSALRIDGLKIYASRYTVSAGVVTLTDSSEVTIRTDRSVSMALVAAWAGGDKVRLVGLTNSEPSLTFERFQCDWEDGSFGDVETVTLVPGAHDEFMLTRGTEDHYSERGALDGTDMYPDFRANPVPPFKVGDDRFRLHVLHEESDDDDITYGVAGPVSGDPTSDLVATASVAFDGTFLQVLDKHDSLYEYRTNPLDDVNVLTSPLPIAAKLSRSPIQSRLLASATVQATGNSYGNGRYLAHVVYPPPDGSPVDTEGKLGVFVWIGTSGQHHLHWQVYTYTDHSLVYEHTTDLGLVDDDAWIRLQSRARNVTRALANDNFGHIRLIQMDASGASWVSDALSLANAGDYYSYNATPIGTNSVIFGADNGSEGTYKNLTLAKWNGASWNVVEQPRLMGEFEYSTDLIYLSDTEVGLLVDYLDYPVFHEKWVHLTVNLSTMTVSSPLQSQARPIAGNWYQTGNAFGYIDERTFWYETWNVEKAVREVHFPVGAAPVYISDRPSPGGDNYAYGLGLFMGGRVDSDHHYGHLPPKGSAGWRWTGSAWIVDTGIQMGFPPTVNVDLLPGRTDLAFVFFNRTVAIRSVPTGRTYIDATGCPSTVVKPAVALIAGLGAGDSTIIGRQERLLVRPGPRTTEVPIL